MPGPGMRGLKLEHGGRWGGDVLVVAARQDVAHSVCRKYWRTSQSLKGKIQGPFPIAETWPALPATLDAAFQDLLTKKIFFFAGENRLSPARCPPGCPLCPELSPPHPSTHASCPKPSPLSGPVPARLLQSQRQGHGGCGSGKLRDPWQGQTPPHLWAGRCDAPLPTQALPPVPKGRGGRYLAGAGSAH